MPRLWGLAGVVGIIALVLLYSATFFVEQSQNAVVVRFGRLIETVKDDPGLHWRMPFIDNVAYVDRRTINTDAPSATMMTGGSSVTMREMRRSCVSRVSAVR